MFIITARYLVYTHFSQSNADVRNAHTRPQHHRSHRRIATSGPKLGLRMPEFSPSGAEHSSAGYRYGVCFMQTPTLPQRHQPLRRLHCPAPVEYHAYIRLFLQYAHNFLRGYVKTCYK